MKIAEPIEGLDLEQCRTQWQQNRLDIEAGRPLTFMLTSAQIAAAKTSIKEESTPREDRRGQWHFPYPEALRCYLSLLPISSGIDVKPSESVPLRFRGSFSYFPLKVFFADPAFRHFEIDQLALNRAEGVLLSRARGDRIDLATIDEVLCRVVIPSCVDLEIIVRNIDIVPHPFMCGIAAMHSVMDRREDLLRNCLGRRPGAHAWWWKPSHQRIVDLPEEEARRIDALFELCADGLPRRDFRTPKLMQDPGWVWLF